MSSPESAQPMGRSLLAPATLGGAHALRNALQVLKAYTINLPESGPAREAIRSSISRILAILELLEILAGNAVERRPTPEELAQAFQLLPELFVYPLREQRIRLDTSGVRQPSEMLAHWELFSLTCLLLEGVLADAPTGPDGSLRLDLEDQELRLAWVPVPGALPFPMVRERIDPLLLEHARRLGLELRPISGGLGFRLSPARVPVAPCPTAFLP